MAYTPLPNPWTGIPLVGPLVDAMQTELADLTSGAAIPDLGEGATLGDVIAKVNVILQTLRDRGVIAP